MINIIDKWCDKEKTIERENSVRFLRNELIFKNHDFTFDLLCVVRCAYELVIFIT